MRPSKENPRLPPRERLLAVDADRIALRLARDFAVRVARVSCGDHVLPGNHAALQDALRNVIREQLRLAQEQA
jgi:hypothetical protein